MSLEQSQVEIELLTDHLDRVPELARRFHEQWPISAKTLKESGTLTVPAEELERRHQDFFADLFVRNANRDHIPLTLIALRGERLLGAVGLLRHSVSSHRHLAPWVAALYVVPEERHRGFATRLVAAAEGEARKQGYAAAYIGISAGRAHYERRGWRFLEIGHAGNDEVVVLTKDIR